MDGEVFLKNYISARVILAVIVSDKKEKYTVNSIFKKNFLPRLAFRNKKLIEFL
jgi:hypothetical protein